MKTNLCIINNEKCFKKNGKIFCENIEIKLLAEDFQKYFNTKLILRHSNLAPVHEIKNTNISVSSNIMSFLKKVLFSIFENDYRYLIISVTPYTFLSFIILLLFRRKIFLYLRSDGKKEIDLILGKKYLIIYKFMELLMARYSKLITVNTDIIKDRNYKLVNPSSIDENWFQNTSIPELNNIKLLYVGRLKIEKGIYSLINLFNQFVDYKKNASLTLIGQGEKIKNLNSQIKQIPPISDKMCLIDHYDKNNVVILPSFTEGHPRVLIESLARKRPIIIFEDIAHVKKSYQGVYICKRELKSLILTIEYIMQNYKNIQKQIEKNSYPTKENFIIQLKNIIND